MPTSVVYFWTMLTSIFVNPGNRPIGHYFLDRFSSTASRTRSLKAESSILSP